MTGIQLPDLIHLVLLNEILEAFRDEMSCSATLILTSKDVAPIIYYIGSPVRAMTSLDEKSVLSLRQYHYLNQYTFPPYSSKGIPLYMKIDAASCHSAVERD